MNWEPTATVILIYLAVVAAYAGGYHLLDRWIGSEELKQRFTLAWLAIRGKDYRIPDFDPGMVVHQDFPDPGQADDPITAILVRASEAERQWYALHHLIDQWETRGKHQQVLQPQEERFIHDFLHRQYREATEEAKESIRSRMQMRNFTTEEGMAERYIIEDPATGYRVKVQMAGRDVIRFDPRPGGDLPPPVEQRMQNFPQQVLREVEERSDTQHCWV